MLLIECKGSVAMESHMVTPPKKGMPVMGKPLVNPRNLIVNAVLHVMHLGNAPPMEKNVLGVGFQIMFRHVVRLN